MKELLGSFDELNKLERIESGGGGGIEFGEEIDSATSGARLQAAFKSAGEAIATFTLTLGGPKIAQQVAQWIAPLFGIAYASAASIRKWSLAL